MPEQPIWQVARRLALSWKSGAGFVDGLILPIDEACIPITDLGFLHSDATYDVVHAWKGRFFRLQDHLDRFLEGVRRLHMKLPYDCGQIRGILAACVQTAGLEDAYVEMICTRGIAPPGSRDPRQCKNRFYAFAVPFAWIATPAQQDQGVSLHVSQVQRIPPESVDPSVKNYHWLDLVRGQYAAYDAGQKLAVLVDAKGNVTEGAGFNIFMVKDGVVSTPAAGVLQGITRRTALELARAEGLETTEQAISADTLRQADEVFLTSTAGGIIPVREVDGAILGENQRPVTQQLRARYWELHSDPEYSRAV